MIGPLIYWILVASVLGYYLLTAATQYLPASQVPPALPTHILRIDRCWHCLYCSLMLVRVVLLQVAAFQCLQPFMGTVLAFLILGEQPSVWDLGAVGVVAGLILIVREPKGEALGSPFTSRV